MKAKEKLPHILQMKRTAEGVFEQAEEVDVSVNVTDKAQLRTLKGLKYLRKLELERERLKLKIEKLRKAGKI